MRNPDGRKVMKNSVETRSLKELCKTLDLSSGKEENAGKN
jgi:hypothetical protein